MSTTRLTQAVCPTCGTTIPLPLDVQSDGRVECPRDHRVPAEEVVRR